MFPLLCICCYILFVHVTHTHSHYINTFLLSIWQTKKDNCNGGQFFYFLFVGVFTDNDGINVCVCVVCICFVCVREQTLCMHFEVWGVDSYSRWNSRLDGTEWLPFEVNSQYDGTYNGKCRPINMQSNSTYRIMKTFEASNKHTIKDWNKTWAAWKWNRVRTFSLLQLKQYRFYRADSVKLVITVPCCSCYGLSAETESVCFQCSRSVSWQRHVVLLCWICSPEILKLLPVFIDPLVPGLYDLSLESGDCLFYRYVTTCSKLE